MEKCSLNDKKGFICGVFCDLSHPTVFNGSLLDTAYDKETSFTHTNLFSKKTFLFEYIIQFLLIIYFF